MGPSWVDPRTGEIINATVLVYNDVIKLIKAGVLSKPHRLIQEYVQKNAAGDY